MSGHSPRPELRPGENPGSSTYQGRLAAWQAVPATGGTDLSGVSTTTLEFMALGGDQDAIAELEKRRGAGGEATTQDLGNGLVLVTHPDGTTEVRSVSTGTDTSGGSFASSSAGIQQAFENEQTLLGQSHENALAILQQQLESASGINAQNIQAQIDLENLRHENDLAEMALQFENQLKQTTLGEIGATTRTLIQEKGQERARQTELAGRDIFKFTANLRGRSRASCSPGRSGPGCWRR